MFQRINPAPVRQLMFSLHQDDGSCLCQSQRVRQSMVAFVKRERKRNADGRKGGNKTTPGERRRPQRACLWHIQHFNSSITLEKINLTFLGQRKLKTNGGRWLPRSKQRAKALHHLFIPRFLSKRKGQAVLFFVFFSSASTSAWWIYVLRCRYSLSPTSADQAGAESCWQESRARVGPAKKQKQTPLAPTCTAPFFSFANQRLHYLDCGKKWSSLVSTGKARNCSEPPKHKRRPLSRHIICDVMSFRQLSHDPSPEFMRRSSSWSLWSVFDSSAAV